jgi:hypothetical protein
MRETLGLLLRLRRQTLRIPLVTEDQHLKLSKWRESCI